MRIVDLTPSQKKFNQARKDELGVLIRYKHSQSDEVLAITEGSCAIISEKGYWCTVHGGFNYIPCSCSYETRITNE